MEVIPAIDLKNGKCVRLYQGDFNQETVFSSDPLSVALRWQALGARRLHLVDLDGAASGAPQHLHIIESIARTLRVSVEVGGGIRTMGSIRDVLAAGAGRAILGTAAVEDEHLVEEACAAFGEAIVIGIDARDGLVATHGWQKSSGTTPAKLARRMVKLGAKRFIYTDIQRDGTLSQPNFDGIRDLLAAAGRPVIASGGVASVDHLRRLADLGAEGAIVGKALYTGDIDLGEALQALSGKG